VGGATGGREQLSSILNKTLRHVAGDELEVYELWPKLNVASVSERLFGRIDGITSEVENNISKIVSAHSYDYILVDGSNLGRLVKLIKSQQPAIPVMTFYHNVEARFFFDAFRATPSLHALGVLAANTIAERWATCHSDFRVMLNNRDSQQLGKLYGRQGTQLLPMVVPDFYYPAASQIDRPLMEKYALFVGGSFYANVEGLAWYAKNIAPSSPIQTIVIGRGMEAHRARLEQWGGVCVVGEVDDLAPWYAHAQIIVAPILSGSGMKTKTAEALMHGKPIVGTSEAFVGYRLGWTDQLKVCEEPAQFVVALQNAAKVEAGCDCSLRAHYEKHHSEKAMQSRLIKLLQKVLQNNKLNNFSKIKEI
jgi:glycosyltransferase involved in cell wall biosynthesis